jgi:hypothetical protein
MDLEIWYKNQAGQLKQHFFAVLATLPAHPAVHLRSTTCSTSTLVSSLGTSWGRCFDHNFMRFSTMFGEKLSFFSKTNVIIKIFHNLALFLVKCANFSAEFVSENTKKS